MGYPGVTIGICTKNSQKTINKVLESLLTLDYSKDLLEVIVVDGLSSDKTMTIIKNFVAKSKLKVIIISDSGLGLGYARKQIVECSSAELIAFVDSDQYLHPLWLKEAIKDLVTNSKIGGVRGIIGLTPCASIPARLEAYEKYLWDATPLTHIDVWSFGVMGCLFRKSAIVDAGSFNPKITEVGEDTDLAFRMINKGWKLVKSRRAIFYHQPRTTWKALFRQRCGYAAAASVIGKRYIPFKTKKRLLLDVSCYCLDIRCVFKFFGFTHDLACVLLPVKNVFIEFGYFLTFALR